MARPCAADHQSQDIRQPSRASASRNAPDSPHFLQQGQENPSAYCSIQRIFSNTPCTGECMYLYDHWDTKAPGAHHTPQETGIRERPFERLEKRG
ncbi:hypothetical protein D3C75_648680 [compost metagenome]